MCKVMVHQWPVPVAGPVGSRTPLTSLVCPTRLLADETASSTPAALTHDHLHPDYANLPLQLSQNFNERNLFHKKTNLALGSSQCSQVDAVTREPWPPQVLAASLPGPRHRPVDMREGTRQDCPTSLSPSGFPSCGAHISRILIFFHRMKNGYNDFRTTSVFYGETSLKTPT